ncbi:MAG: SDR family oxidoreductase, partial [Thermoleophilaceae bacterium]
RSADKLEALAGELGDSALAVPGDVTDWDDHQQMVGETLERFGRIDAAFANAGFGARRGFLEETPEQWREMVLTNVLGPALTIRALLPHFLENDRGHFLITSSVAGRRALPGSLYSATKHAATAIGEALRTELRQMHENFTVRVTLLEPGMVDTPFFDNKPEGALEPEDIAAAVMFALEQPQRVDVNEMLIRPVQQPG